MNALVDALACYDVPRENVRILSIGTGDAAFTVELLFLALTTKLQACRPLLGRQLGNIIGHNGDEGP